VGTSFNPRLLRHVGGGIPTDSKQFEHVDQVVVALADCRQRQQAEAQFEVVVAGQSRLIDDFPIGRERGVAAVNLAREIRPS
jgi:hypothetical protein